MNEQDTFVRKRLLELANQCYHRDILTHSDFLGLHEQSLLGFIRHEMPPVCCQLMGGYRLSERKIAVFYPDENYPVTDVLTVLSISPVASRSFEELTHRDYLGAIMNLGIRREQFGDLVKADKGYYLFALPAMAEYLMQNLTKVAHTRVKAEIVNAADFTYEPERKEIVTTVSSIRLDTLIAAGFSLSRNHIISYIEDGKVSVNGQIITTNAYNPKEEDIISVRGLGKICYRGNRGLTRKGRLTIEIDLYI